MFTYLSKHPEVKVRLELETESLKAGNAKKIVRVKETGFFNIPIVEGRARKPIAKGRYIPPNSWDEYMAVFPELNSSSAVITGEATPNYLPSHSAPFLVAHSLPHARLILILRDPIKRAMSRISHTAGFICRRIKSGICSNDAILRSTLSEVFDIVVQQMLPEITRCFEILDTKMKRTHVRYWGKVFRCFSRRQKAVGAYNKNRAISSKSKEKSKPFESPFRFTRPRRMADGHVLEVQKDEAAPFRSVTFPTELTPFVNMAVGLSSIEHGIYSQQFVAWERAFPASSFLFLLAEDFFKHPDIEMKKVENHLQLKPTDWSGVVKKKYNVGFSQTDLKAAGFVEDTNLKPKDHSVSLKTSEILERFFHPFNVLISRFYSLPEGRTTVWPYPSQDLF